MVRKLKTYQASIGFFDLAVAAPSMKAALKIWGADSNLFHQGFATETDDPAIVSATVAHSGVVLRRAVGTNAPFRETSPLPKNLPKGEALAPRRLPKPAMKKAGVDDAKARKAAEAFDTAAKRHDAKSAAIEAERDEIERRAQKEQKEWERQRQKLENALNQAKIVNKA